MVDATIGNSDCPVDADITDEIRSKRVVAARRGKASGRG